MIICLFVFNFASFAIQPVITTIVSTNETITTFTVSGKDLPELKRISFTCTSRLPREAIMDAIIATPVPAAVINVKVDSDSTLLHILLVATSTVKISSNVTIFTFKIPMNAATDASSFFIDASTITDKNGAVIQASLDPASIVRGLSRVSAKCVQIRNVTFSSIYLLNGRCHRSSNKPFATSGLVLIQQPHSSVHHSVLLK